MVRRLCGGIAMAFVTLAACELDRVTIAGGDAAIVVHAVMRPDQFQQVVVVERGWNGDVDPEEKDDNIGVPPGAPQLPISGAIVTVANLDLPADPCGAVVAFGESFRGSGTYLSPPNCPTMRVGDVLELTVVVGGERVRGRTRVPSLDSARLRTSLDTIRFGTNDTVLFNRDVDTMRVEMWSVAGRLMQFEVGRLDHLGRVVTDGFEQSIVMADSTQVSIPGNVVDVFERGEGAEVFRAGRNYLVTVAAADTNYFDFVRSFNRPVTGRGFINRLEGGIGVFGAMVAGNAHVVAIGNVDDPREGVYRLTGRLTILDFDLDVTVSQYLRHPRDTSEVYGFLSGTWYRHALGPEGAEVLIPWDPNGLSVEGTFRGDTWRLTVKQSQGAALPPYELRLDATRASNGSFTVTAREVLVGGFRPIGTLVAVQQ